MNPLRIVQVITRGVRGGAMGVVRCLLDRLPREEFEQTLLCGPEAAPDGAIVVPELVRELREGGACLSCSRLNKVGDH